MNSAWYLVQRRLLAHYARWWNMKTNDAGMFLLELIWTMTNDSLASHINSKEILRRSKEVLEREETFCTMIRGNNDNMMQWLKLNNLSRIYHENIMDDSSDSRKQKILKHNLSLPSRNRKPRPWVGYSSTREILYVWGLKKGKPPQGHSPNKGFHKLRVPKNFIIMPTLDCGFTLYRRFDYVVSIVLVLSQKLQNFSTHMRNHLELLTKPSFKHYVGIVIERKINIVQS